MKFFSSAAALLAFAASAIAQTADFDPIYKPASGEVVPAGETYTITWSAPAKYADVKITISLIGGETQGTQVPLMDIATGVANSALSYAWAVDASLGAENVYGLVFKDESDTSIFQYSNPFSIKAAAGGATTSTSASATTTLTTKAGVKTVTLSSSTVSSTPVTTVDIVKTTTVPCTTSTPVVTPTTVAKVTVAGYNCTTLSTAASVPVVVATTSPATAATTTPATVVTGAAGRVGASSLVAVAGLVLAALAL